MAGSVASQMQAGTFISGLTDVLDRTGASYPNPLGIFPRHGWFSGFLAVIDGLILVCAVLSVASVFARRRGASIERRKQLAWLGYVSVLTGSWIAAAGVNNALTHGKTDNWIGGAAYFLLVLTPVAGSRWRVSWRC